MTRTLKRFAIPIAIGVGLLMVTAGQASGGVTRTHLFAVDMQGENEVPDPGDPDGEGQSKISLDSTTGDVCWRIRVRGITLPASAAHIHEGDPGVPGGIVVTLSPPDATGHATGCTVADTGLVSAIIASPGHYYVNVHNGDYPGGALRDQLSTTPPS